MRARDLFTTVRTEGGLLPADFLQRIASGDRALDGLTPESYHLDQNERINEATNRAWNRLVGAWAAFRGAREKLQSGDLGTTATRERWLLVLFQELGYGRLVAAKAIEVTGKTFPISHMWNHTPIHLVGCNVDMDRRTKGAKGAAGASPHGLVQEFLNRSDECLWGIISNGICLRLLRDNISLTRQAYVEFDLEAMMEGEVYSDFVVLWLLCHQSRVEADEPNECWLERWSTAARQQGTRALDRLRVGVEAAIEALGRGFLAHSKNGDLREKLRVGTLDKQDYYRQLLRLVYRLLFLFVAEDRDLLLDPSAAPAVKARYWSYYSTVRLRRLAQRRRGSPHADLYRGLRVVMEKLGTDTGCVTLGLPALGSFLWSGTSLPDLGAAEISNAEFLDAIRAIAFTLDGKVLRAIDYKNLAAEELGSVYESLLELHPDITAEPAAFNLTTVAGHERKTTGSYYTPESLVQSLLDSALDPVLDEVCTQADPQDAILSLKICDPACGSGHFLIAAAHRIAKRLAAVRTGDEEPSPDATRKALRDVIGHCIYGVDLNPMAIELCKVSLWMEALEPGKPLSFLDHRIVRGNSLLGTTPALLAKGIPDDAFSPIEGDDRRVVSALKRQNRKEREGQTSMFAQFVAEASGAYASMSDTVSGLDALVDDSITAIHQKERRYRYLVESSTYANAKLLADAWCAAFAWKKAPDASEAITQDIFVRLQREPNSVPVSVRREIERLAEQYQLLHWHVAFPDVFRVPAQGEAPDNEQAGWSGGFDAVLGNPPWERIKLQEKEWFASVRPDIAAAPNAAARRKMIVSLETDDPALYASWIDDSRKAEGESHLVRNSGRYPLCGRGDINTYAVFAETNRLVLGSGGRVGCIMPPGIATDDTTKFFFQDLVDGRFLVSLFHFENEGLIFPGVHHAFRFCLLTIAGHLEPVNHAEFVFFARRTSELTDPNRRFTLSADDIALLNPNTRTCPVFRSARDADLIRAIYGRVPVLIRKGPPEENLWGVSFVRMFDMSNDSDLFRTREQLEEEKWRLQGNVFHREGGRYLPLYEAKMMHHFDHRFGTYQGQTESQANQGKLPELGEQEHLDPSHFAVPHYWVQESEVQARVNDSRRGCLLGWRGITGTEKIRTVIASLLPQAAFGNSLPLMILKVATAAQAGFLAANLSSFILDFAARSKVAGTNLNFFIYEQLPILSPEDYGRIAPWSGTQALENWLRPRTLELTYTAWDLEPFARDCGYTGAPFRWSVGRRFLLRAELDAAFFHLYGVERIDVDYTMEAFPIVKRRDEQRFGDYRTKLVILDIYDRMQRAIETGKPYQTLLDPPPADPRVAHPPRPSQRITPTASSLPFRRIEKPSEKEKYNSCVPILTLKAAAGGFSDWQNVAYDAWAEIRATQPLRRGMFVAQVDGHSMEPLIPDGAWCLFSRPVLSIRRDMIGVVQARDISDPDTGGNYTIKRIKRIKGVTIDETEGYTTVRLEPVNPEYQPLVLEQSSDDDVRVIAELVEVINS